MKRAWLALALSGCATTAATPPLPTGTAAPLPPTTEPGARSSDASAPPPPAWASAPEPSNDALVARMLERVELARGLRATKPVPGIRLDRAELIAHVKRHVNRELPPEEIRNEGLSMQLFGFVPVPFDYEAAEYRLLEQQLAGYYEPADGTMYLANDLPEMEASATLAHELVHALQDQHWNLEARSKFKAGDGDRLLSVSQLAEGDATSAMFDLMMQSVPEAAGKTAADIPDGIFIGQVSQEMSQGIGSDVPHVMRTTLIAPYVYGTLFVNRLRRRGGWAAVDGAWDNPPLTTEQILHLDKFDAGERPLAVPAPASASLGSGWQVLDDDSSGELGARLFFEEWMTPELAAKTSAGWGGDRGVLAVNGDRAAYAWRLRYDAGATPDALATRAFVTLTRSLDVALGPAKVADSAFACRERADRGPIAVAKSGADLVFVFGPAKTGATWSSAGDCAGARAWTRAIVAR